MVIVHGHERWRSAMKWNCRVWRTGCWLVFCAAILAPANSHGSSPAGCVKVVLTGEVSAGQEWKAVLGQGWVFRVLPIDAGREGYSGWDLAVDREQPAGFPDALLLATPPFDSISEREVGTTFGLRAQDAIGWNPRSFRFLTDMAALREAQRLFLSLDRTVGGNAAGKGSTAGARVTRRLMELGRQSSAGQFRILNARLTPGIADAAPYAENWAIQSVRTPHTVAPSTGAKGTAFGKLEWIRFSVTLWMPAGWKAPAGLHVVRGVCSE